MRHVTGQPKTKNSDQYITLDSYRILDPHRGHTLAAAGILVVHSLHILVFALLSIIAEMVHEKGNARQ